MSTLVSKYQYHIYYQWYFSCDYCMKKRYEFPSRHFFEVEPIYTLLNIHWSFSHRGIK